MAWELDKQRKILRIEDHGTRDGVRRYRVSSFMRVERGNGEVYLEPLPALTSPSRLGNLYDFAAIEIVPPPAAQFRENGVQQLTAMFPNSGELGNAHMLN